MRGSWRPNRTATYWPPLLWPQQRFFPVLLGCSTEGLGAQPLWDMVLIPASSLQLKLLNRGSWGPLLLGAGSLYRILSPTDSNFLCRGYIIIWRPLLFLRASQFHTQFNPSTVKAISWYSLTGCNFYLHMCLSFFDSLAGSEVNIQHE